MAASSIRGPMQTAENHSPSAEPHDRPRVLVVDDDDALREIYVDALGGSGYDVRGAHDGRAALELFETGWIPCVAFLDLRMPGMDGWELARRIRADERWQHVRIVVVAAHFRIDREAAEIGASAWLQKPFDLGRLEQHARTLCDC
jgi:CheY-like chemotaxis protein